MPQDSAVLKMRIERTDKTTKEDVKNFYITVNRMAENLGFKVIAPKENNQHLALRGEIEDE
tara:strand:+ start:3966 stop:4148 length:183 start_codon:yes stop_codon:yes gene_type:complete